VEGSLLRLSGCQSLKKRRLKVGDSLACKSRHGNCVSKGWVEQTFHMSSCRLWDIRGRDGR